VAGGRQQQRRLAAGQAGSQWSAWAAVLERRGSITMSFAPRRFASTMRWACGLK